MISQIEPGVIHGLLSRDSVLGVYLQTLGYQVLEVVSLVLEPPPVSGSERQRARAVLVASDLDRLVGHAHFVEHDAEGPHINC